MDIDLDNLKTEILDYLHASEFAVFRSAPGTLDAMSLIEWDTEAVPDYRQFLDAASGDRLPPVLCPHEPGFPQVTVSRRH